MAENLLNGDFVKTKYKDSVQYLSTMTDFDAVSEKNGNLPSVGEFMNSLFQKQLFTDVTFFPSKGKMSISAHRVVLAAKCPYFEEKLFGSRKIESTGMEMRVQISNLSFDIFCNIIEYFYTDEIDFTDDSTVMEILIGAEQFQIQSLVERCQEYIESIDLTADNVCSTLQISDEKNIKSLKQRCIQYIEENTEKVIDSADFDKSAYDTVHKICNLQSFNLNNEVQLLTAIVRWINLQPSHTQSHLKTPLLACVRFLTLTAREFSNAIKEYEDFLDTKDALKILMFLNSSTTEDTDTECLPKWCNRSIRQRCFAHKIGSKESKLLKENHQPRIVMFPLKLFAGDQNVTELTSLMQMKCKRGSHQLDAIKFTFQEPVNKMCAIKSLTLSVIRFPNLFRHQQNITLCNTSSVRIQLSKVINVRRGDSLHIEAVARNIHFYKFLQFDEACKVPSNRHFECCIQGHPRTNRLFFISEIEYSPQISQPLRSFQKAQICYQEEDMLFSSKKPIYNLIPLHQFFNI